MSYRKQNRGQYSQQRGKSRLFLATIDKNFAGKCAGMGVYFIPTNSKRVAASLAKARCKEESDYDPDWEWKLDDVEEIPQGETVEEFVAKKKDRWFVLKP